MSFNVLLGNVTKKFESLGNPLPDTPSKTYVQVLKNIMNDSMAEANINILLLKIPI